MSAAKILREFSRHYRARRIYPVARVCEAVERGIRGRNNEQIKGLLGDSIEKEVLKDFPKNLGAITDGVVEALDIGDEVLNAHLDMYRYGKVLTCMHPLSVAILKEVPFSHERPRALIEKGKRVIFFTRLKLLPIQGAVSLIRTD